MDLTIPVRRPDWALTNKKRTYHLEDSVILADPGVKYERKQKDRKIPGSCPRAEKNLWNMKVKVIPTVVSTLQMVHKGLKKRQGEVKIRRRIKTIQTTVVVKSARIHWRVLETWRDLLLLILQQKLARSKIIIT